MKKRGYAVLLGLAVNLVLAGASYGKSTLLSLTVEPLWPTNSAPGNVLSYKVTAVREGSGLLNVSLSSLGSAVRSDRRILSRRVAVHRSCAHKPDGYHDGHMCEPNCRG
jgi:hypothetical protein